MNFLLYGGLHEVACEPVAQGLVPEGLFSPVGWSLLQGPVLVSGLDFSSSELFNAVCLYSRPNRLPFILPLTNKVKTESILQMHPFLKGLVLWFYVSSMAAVV